MLGDGCCRAILRLPGPLSGERLQDFVALGKGSKSFRVRAEALTTERLSSSQQTSPRFGGAFVFSGAMPRRLPRESPTMKFVLSNRNQLTNRRVVLGLGTRNPSQHDCRAPPCLPNPHGGASLFRNAKLAAPHSITLSAIYLTRLTELRIETSGSSFIFVDSLARSRPRSQPRSSRRALRAPRRVLEFLSESFSRTHLVETRRKRRVIR
jgi:hypothetical protein